MGDSSFTNNCNIEKLRKTREDEATTAETSAFHINNVDGPRKKHKIGSDSEGTVSINPLYLKDDFKSSVLSLVKLYGESEPFHKANENLIFARNDFFVCFDISRTVFCQPVEYVFRYFKSVENSVAERLGAQYGLPQAFSPHDLSRLFRWTSRTTGK